MIFMYLHKMSIFWTTYDGVGAINLNAIFFMWTLDQPMLKRKLKPKGQYQGP